MCALVTGVQTCALPISVACARSGARTTFICALGDDPGGQLARALAADNGIDLRDLHSTEPTGTAGIYVDGEGRNSIVIGAGANAALSAGHVDAQLDAFDDAGVVLAPLESTTEAIAAAPLAIGRPACRERVGQ